MFKIFLKITVHTCMKSGMNFETAMSREKFVTHVTLEMFDPRVCSYVSRQRRLYSKCSETLVTLVGFLVRVNTYVAH